MADNYTLLFCSSTPWKKKHINTVERMTTEAQNRLSLAWELYDGQCPCHNKLINNCGHYMTNALIAAGFTELDGGAAPPPSSSSSSEDTQEPVAPTDEASDSDTLPLPNRVGTNGFTVCRAGRPVLPSEIHEKFIKKYATRQVSEPSTDSTVPYIAYQQRKSDGMSHVVMIQGWDYRGTGDFRDFDNWTTTYYEF